MERAVLLIPVSARELQVSISKAWDIEGRKETSKKIGKLEDGDRIRRQVSLIVTLHPFRS